MSGKRMRRRYSEEFKRDAVGLVTEQGYSLAETARRRDTYVSVIRNWRDKFMKDRDGEQNGPTSKSEKTELRRLREENRKLRMEWEISGYSTDLGVR